MKCINLRNHWLDELENDYNISVIHLLWCIRVINGKPKRFLLFGMSEFIPLDNVKKLEIPEMNYNHKEYRLYYIRITKRPKEVLDLYKKIKKDSKIDMEWDKDKNGNAKTIYCSNYCELPNWPNLVVCTTKNDYPPFLNHYCSSVRLHSLFPIDIEDDIIQLINEDKVSDWIFENIGWELRDNQEFIGSFHALFYNPIYYNISQNKSDGKILTDKLKVSFKAIDDSHFSKIELFQLEKSLLGYVGGHHVSVDEKEVQLIQSCNNTESAIAVLCPLRGLLDVIEFSPFIGRIGISISSTCEQREVFEPDTGEKYTVYRTSPPLKMHSRAKSDLNNNGIDRAYQNILKRKERQKAINQGFKLFHSNIIEAKEFIRSIISKARKRVTIIDPYFGTIELFKFALAVRAINVKTRIITSNLSLSKCSQLKQYPKGTNTPEIGFELMTQLEALPEQEKIEIFVMTGKKPVVHDRLLIIDDEVWFSGNSLHTIGDRMSMIIKLPNPREVIDKVDEILNCERIKSLKDWVRDRQDKRKGWIL